jgi:hypothetical protein
MMGSRSRRLSNIAPQITFSEFIYAHYRFIVRWNYIKGTVLHP